MKDNVLGYSKNHQPIRPVPSGQIVTHALIMCSICRKVIRAQGGPMHGADCLDCHPMRQAFEQVSAPNFQDPNGTARDMSGQYVSDVLKDHWETFQEAWEECTNFLKNRRSDDYTDIVSNGGMDPRN